MSDNPHHPPPLEHEGSPAAAVSVVEERFETWRKRLGAVLAPLAGLAVYLLTPGLSPEGRTLSGILTAVAVLWVSEVLPLPVTAILGSVLCVLLGVAPARQVLGYFADPIVFLFIGSFMLARAMMIHQLDRRIALGFLSIQWIAAHPARMLAGLGLVTALLSMWVSNTATTAMMLPIGLGVLGALHQVRGLNDGTPGPMNARSWTYATGMMLMIAYAASIGGIGTPVGSPPNLIGIGLIRRTTGVEISFLQWMGLGIPMFIFMGAGLFLLLYWLHPAAPETVKTAFGTRSSSMADYLKRERAQLGPWTRAQVNTLVVFGLAVVLWVTPGILALPIWGEAAFGGLMRAWAGWFTARLPEAVVALLAAVLLFALPVNLRRGEFTLTWDQAVQIDWGTILLFGGGLALGTLMFETGVARAMGEALTGRVGLSSVWVLTGISIALGIILSEATSNTASANMVIPVVIGISQSVGISPIPPALGACLGASYGFMLPVSTPPNAIVYGSGLVSLPSMMRAGILFDVLGFFIIWTGLRILCPLLGLM
jgi:solute carrier family 13 (sodium-dependent dicarboxylate transporter), member 2/3/5